MARVENLFTDKGMKVVAGLSLQEREAKMVVALLKNYCHLEKRISETNTLVDELHGKMAYARLIQTAPWFGKFFSVLVAVEIEDIKRFEEVRKLNAYAGMIPLTHSSGERSFDGKIIKAGNRWLRWAVVEAVWPSLRADFDLGCYYERIKRGKGRTQRKLRQPGDC